MDYTTADFIKDAKKVHGKRYDYSNVKYVAAYKKVKIKCLIHGYFMQAPAYHTKRGCGCSECMKDTLRKTFQKTLEQFISEARKIHGNRYEYSNVIYKNVRTGVDIGCTNCGSTFNQRPEVHLLGRGCPECANLNKYGRYGKIDFEEWIRRARLKHGDSLSYKRPENFKVCRDLVKTRCNICLNIFFKSALALSKGDGCRVCKKNGYSKVSLRWIAHESKTRRIKIQHALNGGEYKIPGTNYRVDGYNKRSKTVFEFHGDRYHGNPKRYKPDATPNPYSTKTAAELYAATKKREKHIKSLGYNLVVMWESDWSAYEKKISKA